MRKCVDPKDLNQAVRRENYPIPTIDGVVASIVGVRVFSAIDAKGGFFK